MEKKKRVKYRVLLVRLEEQSYLSWRKLSYLHETSMSSMIRDLVENKLNESRKMLTNSDIVI